MTNFTMTDFRRLTEISDDVCISIYMPADPSAAKTDGASPLRTRTIIAGRNSGV